jgi:Na+-transporting NADH:ubiquinone oxidoreductase subunit NqrB
VGTLRFELPIQIWHLTYALVGATTAQLLVSHLLYQTIRLDALLSSSISALSLTMILRVNKPSLLALAAILAVGSKYFIRWRGRHFWNPANFALVVMSGALTEAWITPGQWGSAFFVAIIIASAGILVVTRASRWDVTAAFFVSYGGLLLLRAAWLGDPWRLPLRELQSGALIIFAFYMISDPKTTPLSRWHRVVFGVLVAIVAVGIRFTWYVTTAPLVSLAVCAWLVPLFDSFLNRDSSKDCSHWSCKK